MLYVNYRNIRIHQIQIFLAAAESCNYSMAAEKMNVTQSMVSKTIKFLEQETGLILVRKDHGKLYLTPAGKEVSFSWDEMLKAFELSISNAHAIQEAKNVPLHFGLGMATQRDDIRAVLDRLESEISKGEIILENGPTLKQLERVNNGEIDMAIASGHLLPKIKYMDLCYQRISETPLAIYVHKNHPLSARNSISFADLKSEHFIAFSPEADPHYWGLLNRMAEEAGFHPRVGCYVNDELSFLINLERGKGVVFADGDTLDSPNIKKFILDGTHCDLYLIWRADNTNPILKNILKKVLQ